LVHISQLSEDHVAKVKDVLKVGQEVEARVIKVDKVERRIGLSIKAANYSEEQLRKEAEQFDTLRPGEDMVGLEKAFAAAEREERARIEALNDLSQARVDDLGAVPAIELTQIMRRATPEELAALAYKFNEAPTDARTMGGMAVFFQDWAEIDPKAALIGAF